MVGVGVNWSLMGHESVLEPETLNNIEPLCLSGSPKLRPEQHRDAVSEWQQNMTPNTQARGPSSCL